MSAKSPAGLRRGKRRSCQSTPTPGNVTAQRGVIVVCVAVAVAALTTTSRAQARPDYSSLVQAYASGAVDRPVTALSAWSKDDVTNAVRAARTTFGPQDLIAAAILHTDVANT